MLKILQERLARYTPPENPHPTQKASVLIPLHEKDSRLHLLFTQRSTSLRSHSGQVSFPGGKADSTDKDALETALRESHEEIGLHPDQVQILGRLDQIISVNFLLVTPFIGLIPTGFVPRPNASEIKSVFEVPVNFFMEDANHSTCEYRSRRPYIAHHFYFKDYDIWGLTAMLILQFLKIGFHYIPSYPVHHPDLPTWMVQSQQFRDELIPHLREEREIER